MELGALGMSRGTARVSSTKANMILQLHKSGHGPTEVARALGLSRMTIYYHLHPEKYMRKLQYMKEFRSSWKLEHSDWELENG